jgi:RNA polymerase sigma-70 factor (ECF subfamily)
MSDSKQAAPTTDPEAFAGVVETYQVAVFNLCYRMLGDPHQAEEAAQETFLRAFQSRQRYDRSRPLRTWLLSIAAHHCIDLGRRRSLLEFLPFGARQFAHADPEPEAALIHKESGEAIRRMLRGLQVDERAAVILTYWYDMSQAEVAQVTGSSVDAVRTRLYRARRHMAAAADRATVGRERLTDEAPAV